MAKATASTRPARLPRSHAQGSPGQSSVRERKNDTVAPKPGGNVNRIGEQQETEAVLRLLPR